MLLTVMDVVCPRCAAPIEAENVNLESGLAKCGECNAVFDFRQQLADTPTPERPEVEMPKPFCWQETFDGLALVYDWRSASAYGLLFFCLLWNGFMAMWYGIAIHEQEWTMAAFGMIHLAVGLGLIYGTLAKFRNRTTITFSPDKVTVQTRPMRLFTKDQAYEPREIQQIFCEEKITRTKNGVNRSYLVNAQLRGGETKKLLKLEKPEQALYVEQEMERTLNIRDVRVAGEMTH